MTWDWLRWRAAGTPVTAPATASSLSASAYIEIMGIVDEAEAAASPMGSWLREMTAEGDRLAALCLRTDAPGFDATAARLALRPLPMSRDAPGGLTLSWRLAGLAEAMADPSHPFFIDWQIPPDQHPARGSAPHRVEPDGFAWVELGGDPETIRAGSGATCRACVSSKRPSRAFVQPSPSQTARRSCWSSARSL